MTTAIPSPSRRAVLHLVPGTLVTGEDATAGKKGSK